MCPVGVVPSWGLMKRAPCPAPGLTLLHQTAWMGCLILGCIAAPPSGRSLNSVSATRPQAAAASYTHPEQHPLRVTRHRSPPSVSMFRAPTSLRGGHGECGVQPPAERERCVHACVGLSSSPRLTAVSVLTVSNGLFIKAIVSLAVQFQGTGGLLRCQKVSAGVESLKPGTGLMEHSDICMNLLILKVCTV